MKIKNLFFLVLSLGFILFKETSCPIFGDKGWRRQISLIKTRIEKAKQDITNNKTSSTALDELRKEIIGLLNSLKNAKKEIMISTPVRLFFYSYEYYKVSNLKTARETIISNAKFAEDAFDQFIERKKQEVNIFIEKEFALKALKYTNDYRATKGKPKLIWDERMAEAARVHSINMSKGLGNLSHDDFEEVRVKQFTPGWNSYAENVAMNEHEPDVPREIVNQWIGSSGHEKNLVGNFTNCGIGVYVTPEGAWYFTQVFANYPPKVNIFAAKEFALKALEYTNDYRATKGKPKLIWDERMAEAARVHSINMSKGLGNPPWHGLSYDGFDARAKQFTGWNSYAENVAMNQHEPDVPREIVNQWIESSEHEKNLVGNFTHSGIGTYVTPDGASYFTQLFANYPPKKSVK